MRHAPVQVFTSPTRTRSKLRRGAIDGGAGVLHIVKNYAGDMHELRNGRRVVPGRPGSKSEAVVIDDDVAVRDSLYTAGRRGVGSSVAGRRSGSSHTRGVDFAQMQSLAEGSMRAAGPWGWRSPLAPCPLPGSRWFRARRGRNGVGDRRLMASRAARRAAVAARP